MMARPAAPVRLFGLADTNAGKKRATSASVHALGDLSDWDIHAYRNRQERHLAFCEAMGNSASPYPLLIQ
jgi:hypothetical protein